jgi:phosphate transport system protein
MSRTAFSQEMQEIKDELLMLSSMVEQAILSSAEALKNNDMEHAHQVLLNDAYVNRKRFEITISIMALLATQQPIAYDLRKLAASLDICGELGRMGDYAKGIATIHIRSQDLGLPRVLKDIYSMAEKSVDLLHRTMTTFVNEDQEGAKALIREDDEIDRCYLKLYNEAIHSVLRDPENMERANYVIWAAHNLERLGDRVTNICERVVYIVTGERPLLESLPTEQDLLWVSYE